MSASPIVKSLIASEWEIQLVTTGAGIRGDYRQAGPPSPSEEPLIGREDARRPHVSRADDAVISRRPIPGWSPSIRPRQDGHPEDGWTKMTLPWFFAKSA